MGSKLSIWGLDIPELVLLHSEKQYLESLPESLPAMNWVCEELDRVWDEYNLDNSKPLVCQEIGSYYSHPVWLMNGIFSARDITSVLHRQAIAKYIQSLHVSMVADYGGGFGELALAISRACNDTSVHIVEPYPTKVGMDRVRDESKICIVSSLSGSTYDVLVAQDVLEHVDDPVALVFELASATRVGGKLVFANCFYPVIKSHLPHTFHLRYTFPIVMNALGLRTIGRIDGASHAYVFQRDENLSLNNARIIEKISKIAGPLINSLASFFVSLKGVLRRVK